jgi:hypothetical protein
MDAASINAKMAKFVPELVSAYALYPMKRVRWLDPKEIGPRGEPCFIATSTNAGVKPNYVYGRGPYGTGYYSLMTRVPYVNIYSRLQNQPPVRCCALSKEARNEMDEFDDVRRIVYNRSVSTRPDDVVAAGDAIAKARGDAQEGFRLGQLSQLVGTPSAF